mmetsp:Transcript_10113/g.35356  ORF Transcript_10113/g.35356 Transcript_10113/m.35356 type:complete len:284 (-) Transcript_10113:2008-2859(-)
MAVVIILVVALKGALLRPLLEERRLLRHEPCLRQCNLCRRLGRRLLPLRRWAARPAVAQLRPLVEVRPLLRCILFFGQTHARDCGLQRRERRHLAAVAPSLLGPMQPRQPSLVITRQRQWLANDHQAPLRAREGHVRAAPVRDKADATRGRGPDRRHDDRILLPALEAIYGAHLHAISLATCGNPGALKLPPNQPYLRGVRRHDAERSIRQATRQQLPRHIHHDVGLRLVGERRPLVALAPHHGQDANRNLRVRPSKAGQCRTHRGVDAIVNAPVVEVGARES